MTYNWQQTDWPYFRYDLSEMQDIILLIAEKSGLISGKLSHLKKQLQQEALIFFLLEEAIKTSEIEGEFIDRTDIRSSIIKKLGLSQESVQIRDPRAKNIVDLLFAMRNSFQEPLTEAQLFDWNLTLLAANTNSMQIGRWRTHEDAMQIVSGHHGKWIVHYEAPPASKVPKEMQQFIHWFNISAPGQSQEIKITPIRAGIAHLYFESIHPFEDGNGRIGRVIAEKALSQGWGYPIILSLSQIIEADKKAYYAALNHASKSNEITDWLYYFAKVILDAQMQVEKLITFILKKSLFFDKFKDRLNERQLRVVQRMLQEGIKGFEGGMSAKKYMTITDVSKATATRDLQQLQELNIFTQIGSGRSIRYELNLDSD